MHTQKSSTNLTTDYRLQRSLHLVLWSCGLLVESQPKPPGQSLSHIIMQPTTGLSLRGQAFFKWLSSRESTLLHIALHRLVTLCQYLLHTPTRRTTWISMDLQ